MPSDDIPKKARENYDQAVQILQEDMAQRRTMRGTDIVISNLREAVLEHNNFFEAWRLLGEVYLGVEKPLFGYLALRMAHRLRPDDPSVPILLGQAALIMNRPNLATEYLNSVEETDATRLAAKKMKAVALAKSDDWEHVLEAFGDAIAEDPSDGIIRRECAKVLNELKYRSEAASVLADYLDPFRHFIEKQPSITQSGWIMPYGQVLDRLKSGAAKRATGQEVIARPEDYIAWYEMGNVFLDGEKFDAAIICFKRSLRVHPDYYDALHNMGIALEEVGRNEDAMQMYESAIDNVPDMPDAWLSLAELLEELTPNETDDIILNYLMYYKLDPEADGFDELEERLKERFESSPDIAQILLLAEVYLGRDEIDKAEWAWNMIGAPGESEAAYYWIRGRILHEKEQYAEAIGAYEAGLAIAVDESDDFNDDVPGEGIEALIRYDFASLLEESGNASRAMEILQKDPEILNSDGLTLYAELLLASDPEAAEQAWQRAIAMDPENEEALTGYAERLIDSDRIEEGIMMLEQALKADPDDEEIVEKLTELYPKIDAPELIPLPVEDDDDDEE